MVKRSAWIKLTPDS